MCRDHPYFLCTSSLVHLTVVVQWVFYIYNNCTGATYTHRSCPTWGLSVPVSWVMTMHDHDATMMTVKTCTLAPMPQHLLYTPNAYDASWWALHDHRYVEGYLSANMPPSEVRGSALWTCCNQVIASTLHISICPSAAPLLCVPIRAAPRSQPNLWPFIIGGSVRDEAGHVDRLPFFLWWVLQLIKKIPSIM